MLDIAVEWYVFIQQGLTRLRSRPECAATLLRVGVGRRIETRPAQEPVLYSAAYRLQRLREGSLEAALMSGRWYY